MNSKVKTLPAAAAGRSLGAQAVWWTVGAIVSSLFFGTVSLWLGKDANWDLMNYHLYNAYSALFDRLDIDHHPAAIQTFHNPVLDIATYPLLTAMPDWLGGFLLGAFQGFSLLFIIAIGRELLGASRRGLLFSVLGAVAGVTGAATWSEIGTTFGDLTTAVPVLAAIYFGVRALRDVHSQSCTTYLLAAGLLVGIATGLKLTNATLALALMLSMAFLIPVRRLHLIVSTGVTAGIGFLLVNGWWALELYERFSNPLFPYFNEWFKSPYFPPINIKDPRFFPTDILQAIFYPFSFSWNHQTAEVPFRDFRFPTAFLCVFALAARKLTAIGTNRLTEDVTARARQEGFLLVFLVVAYILWLKLYSIQRYAIVIEVLIPLACVIVIHRLLPHRLRSLTAIAVLLLLIVTTKPMNWGRVDWGGGPYVTVHNFTESLDDSVVYLSGPPLAYIAAALAFHDSIWVAEPFNEYDHKALLQKIKNRRMMLLTRTGEEGIREAKRSMSARGFNISGICSSFFTSLEGSLLLCPLSHSDRLDPLNIPNDTLGWQIELVPEVREVSLRRGESTWLTLSMRNSGHSEFVANLLETLALMGVLPSEKLKGNVNIAYHLWDDKGRLLVWDGPRTRIPRSLSPGESIVFCIRITAPNERGSYRLRFDIVQEERWLSDRVQAEDLVLLVD